MQAKRGGGVCGETPIRRRRAVAERAYHEVELGAPAQRRSVVDEPTHLAKRRAAQQESGSGGAFAETRRSDDALDQRGKARQFPDHPLDLVEDDEVRLTVAGQDRAQGVVPRSEPAEAGTHMCAPRGAQFGEVVVGLGLDGLPSEPAHRLDQLTGQHRLALAAPAVHEPEAELAWRPICRKLCQPPPFRGAVEDADGFLHASYSNSTYYV